MAAAAAASAAAAVAAAAAAVDAAAAAAAADDDDGAIRRRPSTYNTTSATAIAIFLACSRQLDGGRNRLQYLPRTATKLHWTPFLFQDTLIGVEEINNYVKRETNYHFTNIKITATAQYTEGREQVIYIDHTNYPNYHQFFVSIRLTYVFNVSDTLSCLTYMVMCCSFKLKKRLSTQTHK